MNLVLSKGISIAVMSSLMAIFVRSYNPRRKSPRGRSLSPRRGRSFSRSSPYHRERYESPYAKGLSPRRGRVSYSRSPAYRRHDSPYTNGA